MVQPQKNRVIRKINKKMRKYIEMVAGNAVNALILIGDGGWGKSWTVHEVLNETGAVYGNDYVVLTTFTTPLKFYEFLYFFRDKIVVVDDCAGIFEDPKSVSILKNAAWSVTGKRFIDYKSTTERLTVPECFEFTGRLIIAMNARPNEDDKNMAALLSRCVVYEMKMTHAEKVKVLREIAKTTKEVKKLSERQRLQVVDFICENADEASKNLNIRTLIKALKIREYTKGDWRELVLELIETDEDMLAAKKAIIENHNCSDQVRVFIKVTGRSARTFYRLKGKLKTLVGVKK